MDRLPVAYDRHVEPMSLDRARQMVPLEMISTRGDTVVVFPCFMRGSLVCTRADMKEPSPSPPGKMKANIETISIDDVNRVLDRLRLAEPSCST
jgi:hypothetical protein